MKCSDVLQCSFSSWYNDFKDVTEKSVVLPLSESFLKYLHTDGLVLPESSTHGVYAKSSNLAMDGEDDDKDLRDDELMKMYEDDWSTPDDLKVAKVPDVSDFDERVTEAITSLGGRVFPKLNWSSPKDASWISFDKTLLCTCPSDIYLLLKSSEFIAHDLDQPFIKCTDFEEASPLPTVEYELVLRTWRPPDPASEFRAFVHNKRLIAISQRDKRKFYSHIKKDKDEITQDIVRFYTKTVLPRFKLDSYVFDIVRSKKNMVTLMDFNPYGEVTDGLMFTWEELAELAAKETDTEHGPTFRCVMSEDGMKKAEYGDYALPRDIQDLNAGEDPFKLMDLLRLRSRAGNPSESSSEEDEDESKVATEKSRTMQDKEGSKEEDKKTQENVSENQS